MVWPYSPTASVKLFKINKRVLSELPHPWYLSHLSPCIRRLNQEDLRACWLEDSPPSSQVKCLSRSARFVSLLSLSSLRRVSEQRQPLRTLSSALLPISGCTWTFSDRGILTRQIWLQKFQANLHTTFATTTLRLMLQKLANSWSRMCGEQATQTTGPASYKLRKTLASSSNYSQDIFLLTKYCQVFTHLAAKSLPVRSRRVCPDSRSLEHLSKCKLALSWTLYSKFSTRDITKVTDKSAWLLFQVKCQVCIPLSTHI